MGGWRWGTALAAAGLAALAALAGVCDGRNLSIGVMVTDTGQWATIGRETRVALGMWTRGMAARGGLGGTGVMVAAHMIDAGDSAGATRDAARALLNGSAVDGGRRPDVLLAPYSSRLTPVAAAEAEAERVLIISGGSASESVFVCGADEEGCGAPGAHGRRYAYLFGLMTPADQYMRPFVSLARINQARTVAMLSEDDSFPLSACKGARAAAVENGMAVLYDEVMPRVTDETDAGSRAAVRERAAALRDAGADVVVACTYAPSCHLLLESLEELDYLPMALGATICVGSPASEAAAGDRLAYVYGPGQWDRRLRGSAYDESRQSLVALFPNDGDEASAAPPEQFAAAFEAAYAEAYGEPRPPSYQAASLMGALYALEGAVALANSTDSEELRSAMQFLFESSFYGLISSSRFGSNAQKSIVTWQYSAGAERLEVVTPLSSAEADSVFPMPRWDEREFRPCMYCLPEERAVIGVVVVLSALSALLAGWLWVFRDRPYVKQASASFCVMSVVASIAVYLSLLTWPVENNAATCAARPWAMLLGIVLVLAPLLARTYRVMSVFQNSSLQIQRITDSDVLLLVGALAAPQFLLLVVWSAVSPLRPEVVVTDPLRPSLWHTVCSSEHASPFAAVAVTYVVALLLLAGYFAYRTRNVWDAFNDARYTTLCIYNLVFCGLMLLIFEVSSVDNRRTSFLVRSFLVIVMVTASQCLLFVPKIFYAVAAIRAETAAKPFDASKSAEYNLSHTNSRQNINHSPSASRHGAQDNRSGSGNAAKRASARYGVTPVTSPPSRASSRAPLHGSYGDGAEISEERSHGTRTASADSAEIDRPRLASVAAVAAAHPPPPPKPGARAPAGAAALKPGWARMEDADGVPYYWHAESGRSVWEAPVEDSDAAAAPSPSRRRSADERAMLRRIYEQLTTGCGSGDCTSPYCRSSERFAEGQLDERDASIRAMQLLDRVGSDALCPFSRR